MKPLIKIKTSFFALENFIRSMSKGYFSDFSEYHPDHTKEDELNDHSVERQGNDFTDPDGINDTQQK
jgi:hypothetical protein